MVFRRRAWAGWLRSFLIQKDMEDVLVSLDQQDVTMVVVALERLKQSLQNEKELESMVDWPGYEVKIKQIDRLLYHIRPHLQ